MHITYLQTYLLCITLVLLSRQYKEFISALYYMESKFYN